MGKDDILRFASTSVYKNPSAGAAPRTDEKTEADINVLSIHLGKLSRTALIAVSTGDPVFCVACKAVLNSLSSIVASQKGQLWTCEFCGAENVITIEKGEIPTSSNLDYIIEPISANANAGNELVIFCIDTSGSMCVTSEVAGTSTGKKDEKSSVFSKFVDKGASQKLPKESKNVTYISRLEAVKGAVASQIQYLSEKSPNCKIAIVSFNDEVQVIGDDGKTTTIAGDKLDEYSTLVSEGSNMQLEQGVRNSKDMLLKNLSELEEQGGTALGPALLVSCAMAAKIPGSKVIICTDGMANQGLGALDEERTEAQQIEASHFYGQVSEYSKSVGVTVSVIAIAGSECSLENLGKVADATGGDVNIVDPTHITQNFSEIVSHPVVATNVQLTVLTHKSAEIYGSAPATRSLLVQNIGNINADTEIPLDFSIGAACDLPKVPFQVQVTYRRTAGPKCIRVVTVHQPVTTDKAKSERDVDVLVIGVYVAKKSAQLVQLGKYDAVRHKANSYKQMLTAAVHTSDQKALMRNFDTQLARAEEELQHAENEERIQGLNVDDRLEEVEDIRSRARTDRTAAHMYHMKGSEAKACLIQ